MPDPLHVPGPWQLGSEIENGCRPIHGTTRDGINWGSFAEVVVELEGSPSEEGEANARLIAAAPDLLDALQSLLDECAKHHCFEFVSFDHPSVKPTFDVARAAIAKAVGKERR
jgi:hypothetical protein